MVDGKVGLGGGPVPSSLRELEEGSPIPHSGRLFFFYIYFCRMLGGVIRSHWFYTENFHNFWAGGWGHICKRCGGWLLHGLVVFPHDLHRPLKLLANVIIGQW